MVLQEMESKADMPDTMGVKLAKDFERIRSDRSNWERHWQKINDVIVLSRDFTIQRNPGDERRRAIYDDTAPHAHKVLSAAIHGLLTNPGTKWFLLRANDPFVQNDPDSIFWMQDTVDRVLALYATSRFGFDQNIQAVYHDSTGFGISGTYVVEEDGQMRIRCVPLPQIYIEVNEKGEEIHVVRKLKMRCDEIFATWGGKSSKEVLKKITDGKGEEKREVIHSVRPRNMRNIRSMRPSNMAWQSIYMDLDDMHIMSEGGFRENPYIIFRWDRYPGDAYGFGPGNNALHETASANSIRRTMLMAGEKAADPMMEVVANGIEGPMRSRPGSIIYTRAGMGGPVVRPIAHGGNTAVGLQELEQARNTIRKIFFNDVVGPVENLSRTNELAVQAMFSQRAQLMSPNISRLQSSLSKVIARTIGMMQRRGDLLPMPPAMLNSREDLAIEYVSPLANAQKASDVSAIQQWIQSLVPMAQINPNVLRKVDTDAVAELSAKALNVPIQAVKSQDQVQQEIQQEQQAQQSQAQVQQAQGAASAALDGARAIEALSNAG